MNIDELRAIAKSIPENKVQGEWFPIRFMPNDSTGELLNIGVAFKDSTSGNFSCRTIENFQRLHCLYSEDIEEGARLLAKVVTESLSIGNLAPPSPSIVYGSSLTMSGHSIEDIVNDLYETLVPLGAPIQKKKDTAFKSMTTEKVRDIVVDDVKERLGIRASIIIPDSPFIRLDGNNESHSLDIPLQGERNIGTIASAWYKTGQSVKNHLLSASLDLEVARHIKADHEAGMFILSPDEKVLTPREYSDVDNAIDSVVWRLARSKVKVEVRQDTGQLAEEIVEWVA
jgi:hypothetical protein